MKKRVFIDKEKYEERIEICKSCPHRKKWVCSKCGCVIPAKAKFGSSSCPIGKW